MFIVPQRTLPAVVVSLLLALLFAVAGGMRGSPPADPRPGVAAAAAEGGTVAPPTQPAPHGQRVIAVRSNPAAPPAAAPPPTG
jgi:hypothetical protein